MKIKRRKKAPVIIGVTGSFGTGKTTVANMFGALGASVLDADKLAHKALRKGTPSYKRIVRAFGSAILKGSGGIDKRRLGRIVFQDKKSLKRLCDIVHPPVIKSIKDAIKNISRSASVPAVVIDAPLLIEAGLHEAVDYLVVVKTTRPVQIERAAKKTGLAADEILRRIKNQMPLSKKIRMADLGIDNDGSRRNTAKIVKKIWEKITLGGKENGRE